MLCSVRHQMKERFAAVRGQHAPQRLVLERQAILQSPPCRERNYSRPDSRGETEVKNCDLGICASRREKKVESEIVEVPLLNVGASINPFPNGAKRFRQRLRGCANRKGFQHEATIKR